MRRVLLVAITRMLMKLFASCSCGRSCSIISAALLCFTMKDEAFIFSQQDFCCQKNACGVAEAVQLYGRADQETVLAARDFKRRADQETVVQTKRRCARQDFFETVLATQPFRFAKLLSSQPSAPDDLRSASKGTAVVVRAIQGVMTRESRLEMVRTVSQNCQDLFGEHVHWPGSLRPPLSFEEKRDPEIQQAVFDGVRNWRDGSLFVPTLNSILIQCLYGQNSATIWRQYDRILPGTLRT